MLNIIKSDLFRILRGKAIYIVILVMLVAQIMCVLTMSPGHIGMNVNVGSTQINSDMTRELMTANKISEVREIMKRYSASEIDKSIIGGNANLYYFFIVVVVIVLTMDFSNKSVKNTLSSAISRKKYYLAKLILAIVLGTVLIFINNYATYILNYFINGGRFVSDLWSFTKVALIQLPLLYGLISLLTCIAFVFRKTSIFNTISIPLIMLVQFIGMAIITLFKINGELFYNYEVQFALARLAENPANDYIIKCAALGVVYIVVFNLIGYFTFKKAEIK